MKKALRLFKNGLLFLILFAFVSCNQGKQIIKDATSLEQGGLRNEAYNLYSDAYYNYARTEGLLGMKRTAQAILETKLQSAQMACMAGNYDAALDAYEDAFSYHASQSKLELQLNPAAQEQYANCKSNYIDALYEEAEKAVRNEEYDKGQSLIRKILSLDRKNQKAQYLEVMCEILPNYNAGVKAMEIEMWRQAYVYFDEVCKVDAGFSNAKAFRDECLKKGSFALVYKIKDSKETPDKVEMALAATIKGELLNSRNPFMELLERENLDVVLQEQQETLSPEFDSDSGTDLGKLKKARFILSGELVHYKMEVTPELKSKCDCGSKMKIYSDKVTCYEITSRRRLDASFKYQLIDAETGKLYLTDVIAFSKVDDALRYEHEVEKKLSLLSPSGTRDHDVDLSTMKIPSPDLLLSEQDFLLMMNAFFSNKVRDAIAKFSP